MNGRGNDAARLRARVAPAPGGGDLERVVARLLEVRFPADGPGASLDEAGTALGMSAALVAHIEFGALCAIAARGSPARAAVTMTGGPAEDAGCRQDERGRA